MPSMASRIVCSRHGIAGRIDSSRKCKRIERVALDRGRLGCEVDGNPFHSGHFGERLFDMRDATCAGHALYRQYEPLGRRGWGPSGQCDGSVGLIHGSKLYALPQAAIGSARDSLSGIKARAFQRIVSTMWAIRSNAMALSANSGIALDPAELELQRRPVWPRLQSAADAEPRRCRHGGSRGRSNRLHEAQDGLAVGRSATAEPRMRCRPRS